MVRGSAAALVLAFAVCVTLWLSALPSIARAAQPASVTIEEIVVTARKREESVQTVPVAVTAISGDALDRQFAFDLTDFTGNVPNASIEVEGISPFASSFFIRGQGSQDRESFADPPVAVIVNGVVQGRGSIALTDLLDVEAIEVLRGPQGTLQGRNSTGGAILLRNNAPDLERLGGSLTLLAGEHERVNLAGVLNVPIVEGVSGFRIAAKSSQFDGFFRNEFDGERIGGQDRQNVLASFLYQTDQFEALIRGEWVRIRDDSTVLVNYNTCRADPRNPANLFTGANDLFTDLTAIQAGGDAAAGTCGGKIDDSDYRVNQNRPAGNLNELDIWGITAELNYTLGDLGTLTYIGNYRDSEELSDADFDATPIDLIGGPRRNPHDQTSHELRFLSDFSDRVELVAGFYYLDQSYEREVDQFLGFVAGGVTLPFFESQDNSQWAVFAQADWVLTDQLSLVTGVRYTEEEKDGVLCPSTPVPCFQRTLGVPGQREEVGDDWSDVSPRLGLNYQYSDNALLYLSWARGFRSGGFNLNASTAALAGPYDEEVIDTYEFGFKLDLLSDRVRMNGALFWMEADDLQRNVTRAGALGEPAVVTANAASARIRGVELELTALLSDSWTLNSSVGYLDAEYKDFCEDLNGPAPNDPSLVPCAPAIGAAQPVDLSGLPIARNPEWNIRTNLVYDLSLGSAGSAAFSVEWLYQDELLTSTAGLPTGLTTGLTQFTGETLTAERDATNIYNANVMWRDRSERYRVSAFVKNLSDEVYIQRASVVTGLFNFTTLNFPRTWGVELSVNF